MNNELPSRDEARKILEKYVTTDHLQRHVTTVEGVMRHFARLYNEDEEAWGILGLLHDIDFELYPEEHLQHAPRILREEGFDDEFIHSVLSHGYGICSDTEPVTNAEKVLFNCSKLPSPKSKARNRLVAPDKEPDKKENITTMPPTTL